MHVENTFSELLARKMRLEKRSISRRDVARETGISITSIQNWATNSIKRFDSDQIVAFCHYFDCGIDDLLIMVEDGEGELAPEMETPLLRAS